MENLNAENVKKALEIHTGIKDKTCEECPYNRDAHDEICLDVLTVDTLTLITSQGQRIGELTEENEVRKRCNTMLNNELRRIDNIKVDTVRKMQEKLMQKILEITVRNDTFAYFLEGYIDQIAKEILEEDQCLT